MLEFPFNFFVWISLWFLLPLLVTLLLKLLDYKAHTNPLFNSCEAGLTDSYDFLRQLEPLHEDLSVAFVEVLPLRRERTELCSF